MDLKPKFKKKFKIVNWPKQIMPEPDMHKLENEEYVTGMDVFGGHNEYRPDCITRSGLFRDSSCCYGTYYNDSQWYIDQTQYGIPGDSFEDARF